MAGSNDHNSLTDKPDFSSMTPWEQAWRLSAFERNIWDAIFREVDIRVEQRMDELRKEFDRKLEELKNSK